MNSEFKKGIHLFYKEIEKVVEGEDKQKYLKIKFLQFLEGNVARYEEEIEKREENYRELIEKSNMLRNEVEEIKNKVNYMENDFYGEEEDYFEITCPYCNYKFEADIEENIDEIRCPDCQNIIELDWGMDDENKEDKGCSNGGCSHCNGCE